MVAALFVTSATAAVAAPYPPASPALTVSSTSVTAGGSVTLSGDGFDANESIVISDEVRAAGSGLRATGGAFVAASTLTTVTADASGSFSATVTLNAVGQHAITATGQTSGRSVTVIVTVTAAESTGSGAAVAPGEAGGNGGLSYTGTNQSMIVFGALGGLLAIIIGGGLLWLGVSRRRAS